MGKAIADDINNMFKQNAINTMELMPLNTKVEIVTHWPVVNVERITRQKSAVLK